MCTLFALTVLEQLHSLKSSSTPEEFVRQFALSSLLTVDLLVSISVIV